MPSPAPAATWVPVLSAGLASGPGLQPGDLFLMQLPGAAGHVAARSVMPVLPAFRFRTSMLPAGDI